MSNFDSEFPKKQLFLDVGNSAVKGAYKQGVNWEPVPSPKIRTARELVEWIEEHPESFSRIILAGVRSEVQQALKNEFFSADIAFREILNDDIPRSLLDYETPGTLGIDRFLACYGATFQTENAVVVIDAGTATTIDYMGRDKIFRGGVIAPGLKGFSQALTREAPALPKVDVEIPKIWPGKSTADSLKWGQAGFYKFAIEGILKRYEKKFGEFDLFITGGNGKLIQQLLSSESKLRPYLVFDGLEQLVSEDS